MVRFDLDKKTGQIVLHISEEGSREVQFQLSPQQVTESLKALEESNDDKRSIAEYFMDNHFSRRN